MFMNGRRDLQRKGVVSFGPFSLFLEERLLKKADQPVPLGGRALDILIALTEQAGKVMTYEELKSNAWPNVTVDEGNLRVQITALRKALSDGENRARYISNIVGRGYCFVAPVTRAAEPPVATAGTTDGGRGGDLPPRLARMVGRDEAVRAVSKQLVVGRFVSIIGPGGIGKTTVAVSVAHGLLKGFRGSVFFVDLGALTNPKLVPAAVGLAIGFVIQARDPFGSLLAFLGDKKILIVLDTCEHLVGAAAMLAERVVSEAPQAHILATSREALRAEGEHVHLLHSLECPPENAALTAETALAYPATQLFMERAAASGHREALSDADAPVVSNICRRLDGVALAIELAASRTGSLGISGTAELLDNRFGLLWRGRRTALPRHETLESMLDWSYNLLSAQERTVLCRLSVFVGIFTLQALCSIASGTEDEAEVVAAAVSLTEKFWLSTQGGDMSAYYRLLDTTRAYAATKLEKSGEADRVARRHAVFYANFLWQDERVQARFGEHDLSEYAPHVGNVRAALDWALSDGGDFGIGLELAAWAAPLFIGLSLLDECARWCERALATLDDTNRGTRLEMILQEALALSSMYTRGHSDQIRTAIERALVLAETLGDHLHQLQLLAGLNLFLTRLGDLRGSLAAAEKGRAIAQATANPAGLVWAEWMLGVSNHIKGSQAAAQFHCERGLALASEYSAFNGNYFGCDHRIGASVALARALWLRGFPDQALGIAQKAIDEAASRNQPISICISLMYSSSVLLWTGDHPSAAALINQLIAYASRYSLEPYRAAGVARKGELAIALGQTESGIVLLRSALEIIHTEQYQLVITTFVGALAEGLRKAGQFEEALFTINGAIVHATRSGAQFDLSELLRIKSQILAARQERQSAIDCLTEALAVARQQSALSLELRATMVLARLLSDGGQRDQARHALGLVYDRFTEGFQTADLKRARAFLEDLRPQIGRSDIALSCGE
jgi:predicted ATPase/DNA-binding winged helix-turn-helix (wHTH) protein